MAVRLASDPVGDVAKQYGVYKEEENVSFRALFVLDSEGRIVSVEKCDFPVGCSMEDQLRQTEAALEGGWGEEEGSLASSMSCSTWGDEEDEAGDEVPGSSQTPGDQEGTYRSIGGTGPKK